MHCYFFNDPKSTDKRMKKDWNLASTNDFRLINGQFLNMTLGKRTVFIFKILSLKITSLSICLTKTLNAQPVSGMSIYLKRKGTGCSFV